MYARPFPTCTRTILMHLLAAVLTSICFTGVVSAQPADTTGLPPHAAAGNLYMVAADHPLASAAGALGRIAVVPASGSMFSGGGEPTHDAATRAARGTRDTVQCHDARMFSLLSCSIARA